MMDLYRDIPELIEACYRCLKANETKGDKWGKLYHFYRPSLTKYSAAQWLWDSGWHMIVWSYRDPENTIGELRSLLKCQQPNGFIPEIIFWKVSKFSQVMRSLLHIYSQKEYTDLTQMPMLAYSIRALWNSTQDRDLLREFVPKIVRYLEWWESRDHDRDGLVSIIHPWESGIDASPSYDPVFGLYKPAWYELYYQFFKLIRIYRKLNWNEQAILEGEYFNVEDVGLCSVYADGWGVLASLAQEFDPKLADKCFQRHKIYQDAVIKNCWSPKRGQFVSYFHKDGREKELSAETVQTLLPILCDDLPKDIQLKLVSKIKNPEVFGLPYPIPSVAKSEVTFNPQESKLLWRGPTWPSTSWLIMEGLLKHGFKKEAEVILDRWIKMYLRYGIYEYYNPMSGQGLGQKYLGMSTIIVDMIYRLKVD
jgi:glycogen debranching enzyme